MGPATVVPPIGGVVIGDWWANWRDGTPEPLLWNFPIVCWGNLGVYLVATCLAWLSSRQGWFVPPVNGILLAAVGAAVLGRLGSPRLGRPRTGPATTG